MARIIAEIAHSRTDIDIHPGVVIGQTAIIEGGVTIYAGATILGRITIGAGSVIGGNVWLTRSVPAGSRVRQGRPSVTIEADEPSDWIL